MVCDDRGQHVVVLPNGDDLSPITETVVTDSCDDFVHVKVTMLCNIAKDKYAAQKLYNQQDRPIVSGTDII